MDAVVPTDERHDLRTVKSCGSGAPTLALSLLSDHETMVAKEPGHQEEHEVSRNTIAQGKPDLSG